MRYGRPGEFQKQGWTLFLWSIYSKLNRENLNVITCIMIIMVYYRLSTKKGSSSGKRLKNVNIVEKYMAERVKIISVQKERRILVIHLSMSSPRGGNWA